MVDVGPFKDDKARAFSTVAVEARPAHGLACFATTG